MTDKNDSDEATKARAWPDPAVSPPAPPAEAVPETTQHAPPPDAFDALTPEPTGIPVSGFDRPQTPAPSKIPSARPATGVVYEGGIPGVDHDGIPGLDLGGGVTMGPDGQIHAEDGADLSVAGKQLRMAQKMMRAARHQIMQNKLRAQNTSQISPTMPRDPVLDADPNVYWSGTHYRNIT